jgi:hypothetical protein
VACLWFGNCEPPPEYLSPEPVVWAVEVLSPEPIRLANLVAVAERPKAIAQANVNRGMGNRTSDVEEWRPLVAGHFEPEDVERVLCLMEHESGGNTHARNPRSTATGLMQIMASVWGPEFGYSRADLEVPETNLWVARQVKDRQGWTAWAPYNRGLCR